MNDEHDEHDEHDEPGRPDADVPPTERDDAPPGAGTGEDPGASAPGLGVVDDDEDLAAAPEPNEPA